jgi:glycosyltransferase involved in cell wall biosynthesis
MPRVGHVIDHFLPLNLPLIYDTITSLRDSNFEPLVFSLKRENESAFPLEQVYAFHSLGLVERNWFRGRATASGESFGVPYWFGVAKQQKPQLLHSHFSWMGKASFELKKRLKIPMVMTLYGEDSIKAEPTPEVKRDLRETLGYADLVIAVSEYVARCARRFGIPDSSVRVVHPGVDTSLFSPGTSKRNGGKVVIGAAGRFDKVKGLSTLLESFKRLSAAHPECLLRMAGGGGNDGGLQEKAKGLGIADRVEFLGWVQRRDLPSFYQSLDLFVLPSTLLSGGITEALGMVVVEAQACSVPVVSTNVGGIPEAVLPGESAALVPPDDAEALGGAIERLVEDGPLRLEMGRSGRENVLRKFDLRKQSEAIASCYKELLSSHK